MNFCERFSFPETMVGWKVPEPVAKGRKKSKDGPERVIVAQEDVVF